MLFALRYSASSPPLPKIIGSPPFSLTMFLWDFAKFAKSHKNIVRLKGGDPIIFGRGGEEAEYLKANNIKYEIVPGITSGIGSATYAGIPLTHRKYASSVVFVTGHEDPEKKNESVKWKRLAQSVDTIVIMMGLSRIDVICKHLVAGG